MMNESPSTTGPNYKREFERERQRLAQLWDAYEDQEKEMSNLKEQVAQLKGTLEEKERIIRSLKEVLATRDTENRELHIELTALRSERTTWDPRVKDLEQKVRLQKDQFGKLYKLAEELDMELKEARTQIEQLVERFHRNLDAIGFEAGVDPVPLGTKGYIKFRTQLSGTIHQVIFIKID